ncbi:MAG TPA: hypothetical protein PLB55_03220 [Prosthecobacter sp.]|jgi:heme/copper-type cytochrome/quinol oxidase subunit 2|nr:hypothetical protein [Prosthecobacter sp.]
MKTMFTALILAFSTACLADFRDHETSSPPTPLDRHNAFITLVIQWLLLVIVLGALAWIVWWGIRMRRRK